MPAASGTLECWSGRDVTVTEIERELAHLSDAPSGPASPRQRTSVMTHVAWVPPRWLDAARGTLEGMAGRHPSRTVLLVPEPDEEGGIDAELSVRCFPSEGREICGEVIELHLRGDRVEAPASIVVPLAIADLPVFLRWRGQPPFGAARAWEELVDLADRVVVDSAEWEELRYRELAEDFERAAFSDLAWARTYPWRVALAGRWPGIAEEEVSLSGPAAETALLAGWLSSRLARPLPERRASGELAVSVGGETLAPEGLPLPEPSVLLSAELDRRGRDPVYEEAVRTAAS